jgi:flagellar hook protein FlgE
MIGSLFTAISGLNANNKAMSTVGDNIANVSTSGFKGSNANFANVLNESLAGGGSGNTTAGAGVNLVNLTEKWDQGSLEPTGNPTDVAISGKGFFGVGDGVETFYTRAGNFQFDNQGRLVTSSGLFVQGYDLAAADPPVAGANIGDITIALGDPSAPVAGEYRNVSIGGDGRITGIDMVSGNAVDLWQITLFDFASYPGLTKKGNNLYAVNLDPNAGSGPPIDGFSDNNGFGKVIPGNLEMSNVDLATEFSKMIVTQKAFQANAKVITTSDEILTSLINMKR